MIEILRQLWLTCTLEEFNAYKDTIVVPEVVVNSSIHSFDEPYNECFIENVTGAYGAIYYVLEVLFQWASKVYLQNIVPYIEWNNPITLTNKDEIILNHKNDIISEITNAYKFDKAVEYFKSL